ncbi:HAD-IA family hydrolase [Streptomyces canus]|uniref:HAD-IA family hydrolase n=1 Tax=Streptomyces canus TaxID=58343 RepID=UPI002E2C2891|nr:HAD-IA family hydrolase [Streptomyces canus]
MWSMPWNGLGLLFDLDGTLVDSSAPIERHTRQWADRHGLEAAEVLELSHGRRDRDIVSRYVPEQAVEAELTWLYELSCRDTEGVSAVPGSLELLYQLPTESWGIVTSAEREVAVARLLACGLPLPRVLVTASDVSRGKPDPEGFLKAAAGLGVSPFRCLVFEDAPAGLRAAHDAGMQAVRVGPDISSADFFPCVSSFKDAELDIDESGARPLLSLTFGALERLAEPVR